MSFLKKVLGSKSSQASDRVRVCSQCGMPVTGHKDWCSILNGQKGQASATVEAAD